MSETRPRRLWLIAPWALFIALVIGWTIYWNVLAHGARTALTAAIAQQQRAGATAEVASVRTRGYPLQLALDITGARYAGREGVIALTAPHLLVHINPVNPRHLIATFPEPLTLQTGATTRAFASPSLMVSMQIGADNRLAYIGTEANDLLVTTGERVDRLGRLVLNLRPDPRDGASWQAALHIERWALGRPVIGAEPLGQDVSALDAAIVLERARDARSLSAWRANDGAARIEALRFTWGAAQGEAQGRIGFDAETRFAGALNITLTEPRRALAAFAAAPETSRDTARALEAIAVVSALSGDTLSLPLRANDGALYLGPARIRALGPVL